jgi:predicted  nucleic acid-binding Zn-ribbon protein
MLKTKIENNVKGAQDVKKKWEDLKNDARTLGDISAFDELNKNIVSIDKIISEHNAALDSVEKELLALQDDIKKEKMRLSIKQEFFESKNTIEDYSKKLSEFINDLNRIKSSRVKN